MRLRQRRFSSLLFVFLAYSLFSTSLVQTAAPVIVANHGPNASQQVSKHYVILDSLDGFRYDYAKLISRST
jgi:hypothetical protein